MQCSLANILIIVERKNDMEYIIIGILLILVFSGLVSDSPVTQNDIANIQFEEAQKQQDSGCGSKIILGVIIIVLIGIAVSGSTTLANI